MFGIQQKWLRIVIVLSIVLLPVVLHHFYRQWTELPSKLRIAAGAKSGLYLPLAQELAKEIERECKIDVEVLETSGSLENIQLLNERKVDFAFYQSGTASRLKRFIKTTKEIDTSNARFIANLYPEIVHLIVRTDKPISSINELGGRRVALGEKESGDYAMSVSMLDQFGMDENSIKAHYTKFNQTKENLKSDKVDAALITVGSRAPILQEIFDDGACRLLSISNADAVTHRDVVLSKYQIPQGMYAYAPRETVETLSLNAQLITHADMSRSLAERVTGIVVNQEFARRNQLRELFVEGTDFAQRKPEFAIHPGAQSAFNPGIRPLLNPDFVEATEGMRSFVVSVLIAVYLLVRWWRDRREKANEHRLDRYIRDLLDIEERQLAMDGPDAKLEDINGLQDMLDEVTQLRKSALQDFSAHELNDDRAADCFLEMCHALSDKINAKLSRLRIDKQFHELKQQLRNV